MSTDHPIIFSAPMVLALLDGRKTMTRRLAWREFRELERITSDKPRRSASPWQKVKPGDQLYVRETHYRFGVWRKDGKTKSGAQRWRFKAMGPNEVYYEESPPDRHRIGTRASKGEPVGQWWKRPSIFMPRWASRLTLVVTATKMERLQDISEEDAIAEGIARNPVDGRWMDYPEGSSASGWDDPRRSFRSLWNALHGDDAWAKNPELVCLSFRVIKANIDAMEKAA